MTLLGTFRLRTTVARVGLALLFACVVGTQMFGFVHRVVHGDHAVAESSGKIAHGAPGAQHGHNCQLFDALTLASCAGATPLQAAAPAPRATFRLPLLASAPPASAPLGFRSRAPPVHPASHT